VISNEIWIEHFTDIRIKGVTASSAHSISLIYHPSIRSCVLQLAKASLSVAQEVTVIHSIHILSWTNIMVLSIHLWLYSPFVGPWPLFKFLNPYTQSVGLFTRRISPSQGRYLHAEQHEHRINAHTHIHALSGIRTHDRSIRADEDSSCLRSRGHYVRHCDTNKYF
jgi:hypothetical protein